MPSVWDAIVVGAGPAGCLVAERLVARGHDVLLLDAGPRPHPGEKIGEVDRRAWAFTTTGGSFDWYRVRAVGGRTLLWGGWFHRRRSRSGEPRGRTARERWRRSTGSSSASSAWSRATPYDAAARPGKCVLTPEMKMLYCYVGSDDAQAFAAIVADAAKK